MFPSCISTLQNKKLNQQARRELEPLFRELFVNSEAPYTLFGDKPMSFYSYCYILPKESLLYENFLEPRLGKHYMALEKYKNFFSGEHFLIVDQPLISDKFPTAGYVRDILLINIRAFIEMVDKHKNLFTNRLGRSVTGDQLLSEIKAGKNILYGVLHEDELLWGILLGYGKNNAQLYARREVLRSNSVFTPSEDFISIKQELNVIEDRLVAFTNNDFDQIGLPRFLCDANDKETMQLKEHYKETQTKVCKIYQSPDFIDLVIKQLKS